MVWTVNMMDSLRWGRSHVTARGFKKKKVRSYQTSHALVALWVTGIFLHSKKLQCFQGLHSQTKHRDPQGKDGNGLKNPFVCRCLMPEAVQIPSAAQGDCEASSQWEKHGDKPPLPFTCLHTSKGFRNKVAIHSWCTLGRKVDHLMNLKVNGQVI